MARMSMSEMTTYRWSFEEDVHQYAAAGIPAIGVWRQKLSDFGEEKGIELLAETGLRVSSVQWAGGFTGSDGRTYRESLQDAQETIRLAATMRAGCVVVYTGARAGHTHNHARRLMKNALGEIVPMADQQGVTLAIEPMHAGCATEWTFLTSLEETLALLDAAASPRIKLALDTYHLCQPGQDLSWIERVAPQVAVVHLGDSKGPPQGEQSRCRLGEGNIPLAEICSALAHGGYDGYYEVELMGEEIEAGDYAELLAQSTQACRQLLGS